VSREENFGETELLFGCAQRETAAHMSGKNIKPRAASTPTRRVAEPESDGAAPDVAAPTINYHLKKVLEDSALEEDAVVRDFRITATGGKTYTKHYNLSATIAVGYKVKLRARAVPQVGHARRRDCCRGHRRPRRCELSAHGA
jgi:hypothetical protein